MSIFGKNGQSFLEPLRKNWAALHYFQQKLHFSESIFVINILIINWLAATT